MGAEELPPEMYRELLAKYLESLPSRLNLIEEAMNSFQKESTKEHLGELRLLIHKLAGNAGTYGFQKVTDLCKTWDRRLSEMVEKFPNCRIDSALFSELNGFLQQIRKEFQGNGK